MPLPDPTARNVTNTANSGRRRGSPRPPRPASLLSPTEYDADAASIRSDQDSDSDDDERQARARNSRELLAHDRLVLMEEDETDQLVLESRRHKEELRRRGSGLPIPNPLSGLFSRGESQSRSPAGRSSGGNINIKKNTAAEGSAGRRTLRGGENTQQQQQQQQHGNRLERKRRRRVRRKAKKKRLLADAQHGEDGVLMYEMEEGGLREGSSTADSSDTGRDESDEVDRKGLRQLAGAKRKRSRSCHLRALVYALIAVGFAILLLVAWKATLASRRRKSSPPRPIPQDLVSNGTSNFAPTTMIISLDGFRADFLNRGLTPRLNALVQEGVSPPYMLPSFPSVTFPNHYTLATGLYPEAHGIVGNSFWDPALQEEFYYTDPARSLDSKWWAGEPFWATAERQGIKSAVHMWPGSEVHAAGGGFAASYVDKYDGKEKIQHKIDRILSFLDMPDAERPQVIAAYVPHVDADGHRFGPNSTEIQATIKKVDRMVDRIFKGLEVRNLTGIVNVVVVSDHGMATTDVSRLIQLEDLVDLSRVSHTDGWPLIGLRPKDPAELQAMYEAVVAKVSASEVYRGAVDVYLRDVNMPERYHFSRNGRIAPLWIVPRTGWALVTRDEMDLAEARKTGAVYHPRGLHGYDHEHPLMRAIFIARGPAFPHRPGSRLDAFQNIEVYNIVCDSVGITPLPNNGTLHLPLAPVGVHGEPGTIVDTPADPADTAKAVGVDPVLQATSTLANSVGITQPTSSPLSSESSSSSNDNSTDSGEEQDKSGLDNIGSAMHQFWDWATDKIGLLLGQIHAAAAKEGSG